MYKHITKDRKLRFFFFLKEYYRISYLFLCFNYIFNLNFNFRNRIIFLKFFHDFLRNTSLSRIHNFCFLTGRSRGIYRYFHMSRLCLREQASKGFINGMKKASW